MTMIAKDPVQSRPGGRSSRVQASVHQAVRKLLERMPREELTFPLIATEAGVTPSTLYRRWGDLPQLLADVALERIRPIAEPADTGSLHGDLQAWTEQYIEEMGSPLGRTLLRDTLVATQEDQVTCACVDIIRDQLALCWAGPAASRVPDVEAMLDQLVAPIVYRILYGLQPDVAFGRKLVEQLVPEQV
jgi:AcrR family transcriptional regulator